MVNEKLLSFINKYRDYDLTNGMNLINIFQDLSHTYPDSLPLDSKEIEQAVVKRATKLGFKTDLLSPDHTLILNNQLQHPWDSYHLQYRFGTAPDFTFKIATIDRSKIALILNDKITKELIKKITYTANKTKLVYHAAIGNHFMPQYDVTVPIVPENEPINVPKFTNQLKQNCQQEPKLVYYYFNDDIVPENEAYNKALTRALPLDNYALFNRFTWITNFDQKLSDLLTLLTLSTKQNTVLNSELFGLSAKLIYIQQSDLSIKTKDDATDLKKVAYDFGPATNAFIKDFKIPDLKQEDYDPDIKIMDLIKYMADVLNSRPVDSDVFNLIAKGRNNTSDTIIINQAHLLQLENILSEATTQEVKALKSKISPTVVQQVNRIWKINKPDKRQTDTDTKHLTLVHGTRNLSVLNILGEGLLDSVTLEKNHSKHYSYTGSGFGRGIYFARLDQADKSYNYTEEYSNSADNEQVYGYMFVADVAYHKARHVAYYDDVHLHQGEDLVWGDGVGSYDRDEIVAQKPSQVHLKYLIELKQ